MWYSLLVRHDKTQDERDIGAIAGARSTFGTTLARAVG